MLINRRKPEVINFLQRTIIHPNFDKAINAISLVHQTHGLQPAGMMLLGDTGVGKSTILEYYVKQHENEYSDDTPVILVRVPAAATTKQVLAEIVDALGGVYGSRPTEAELNRMARQLLRAKGISLVMLDEFQHLSQVESGRCPRQAANTIKNLMNDTQIPFVLAGLEHAESVLHNHPELKRRFTSSYRLKQLGSHTRDDMKYSVLYLRAAQKVMDVPCIELGTAEQAARFHLASGGALGPISRILELAMNNADLEGPGITMEDLAAGYEGFMLNSETANPFRMSAAELKTAMGKKQ